MMRILSKRQIDYSRWGAPWRAAWPLVFKFISPSVLPVDPERKESKNNVKNTRRTDGAVGY